MREAQYITEVKKAMLEQVARKFGLEHFKTILFAEAMEENTLQELVKIFENFMNLYYHFQIRG